MKIKHGLLLFLLTSTLACDEQFQEVRVSGPDGQTMRTLLDPSELQILSENWRQRQKKEKPADIKWTYHVNVRHGDHWTTWLYHSDGWMQVLTKQRVPTYILPSPSKVNSLMGIHDK
jgi:hypothetical protein